MQKPKVKSDLLSFLNSLMTAQSNAYGEERFRMKTKNHSAREMSVETTSLVPASQAKEGME